MSPDEYCQQKAGPVGSAEYYSLAFLPLPQRRALWALYAFCRELEEVVDESSDPQLAQRQLDWWRDQLAAVYSEPSQASHPVSQALIEPVRAHALPQELFSEFIDGMQMNLHQSRYADFKNLQLYCYRARGVVCRLMAEICGYTDRATLKFAHDLGIALQLGDIVCNVHADAQLGRIYLPVADLQQFGVPANDILQGQDSQNFHRLVEFQIERAQAYFSQARAQLPAGERRAQRTGLILAAIYSATLEEIRRDGCRVLSHQLSLTPIRKLWIATRTWLKP